MSPGGKAGLQFRKPLVTNQKDYTSFQALELRVSVVRHNRVAPTGDTKQGHLEVPVTRMLGFYRMLCSYWDGTAANVTNLWFPSLRQCCLSGSGHI